MADPVSSDRDQPRDDRTAPTTPAHEEQSHNGQRGHDVPRDPERTQRPSTSPLTERERRERWPVD